MIASEFSRVHVSLRIPWNPGFQERRKDLPVASPCHPERCEGSVARGAEMLRCAQHDKRGGLFLPYAGKSVPLGSLVLLSLVLVT
jgi:hypothetical protein